MENDTLEKGLAQGTTDDGSRNGLHHELLKQLTDKSANGAASDMKSPSPANADLSHLLPSFELKPGILETAASEKPKSDRHLDRCVKLLKEEGTDSAKIETATKEAQERVSKVSDALSKGDLKSVYKLLDDLYLQDKRGMERLLTNAMLEDRFGISIRKGSDEGFGFHVAGAPGPDAISLEFDYKAAPPHTNDYPSSSKILTISPDGKATAQEVYVGGYTGGVHRVPLSVNSAVDSIKKLAEKK